MLPTTQQVNDYLTTQTEPVSSKNIAKHFQCTTKDINRNRDTYIGIYSNPDVSSVDYLHSIKVHTVQVPEPIPYEPEPQLAIMPKPKMKVTLKKTKPEHQLAIMPPPEPEPQLKAPHPAHFYQNEQALIQWCTYVTKHLPYIPFEIWAIIFKKVRMTSRQAIRLWVEKPYEEAKKKAQEAKKMKRALAMTLHHNRQKLTVCQCREYILSKKTYRAYYSKSKHTEVTKGCPYLYMDNKNQVKQCRWDKLGKEIKSYTLPKFITDT